MKKICRFVKGIVYIGIGFIIPVKALAEADDSMYKCTLKGVKSICDDGFTYVEDWKSIITGFWEWINE